MFLTALRRSEPVSIVDDLNVRVDRVNDLVATQLVDMLTDRGLSNHVTMPPDDLGWMLNIVATPDDLLASSVNVVEVGLLDHRP